MSLARLFVLVLVAMVVSGCGGGTRQQPDLAPPAEYTGKIPAQAETQFAQADQAEKAGNIPQAIAIWERITQSYPNSTIAARSLHRLGNVYRQQGQYDKALQYYDYLLYAFPRYEGANKAKIDRLMTLAAAGKKKQVQKDALQIWDSVMGDSEAQSALAFYMAEFYKADGDIETAFDWLTAAVPLAQKPEEKKELVQAVMGVLQSADAGMVQKLLKKNPQELLRVCLDYRLAQLEMQKQPEAARDHMKALLTQNPTHPLASEMAAAMRGVKGGQPELPLNPNRIGCLLPLNGPYAKYGNMVLKGLSLGVAEWNDKHPNAKVTLSVKDAQTDAASATKAFDELAKNEGVLAVIGPLGAQATKAVTPLADRLNIPVVTLTQKEDDTEVSPYVVNASIDNRDLVRTIVKYCKDRLGYSRYAVLYPDDRYGQKLAKVFAEVVQETEGNVLASVSYKEKTTDFRDPIQKLMKIAAKNAPPSGTDGPQFEALFLPDQVQAVSLIAPQLPYYNVVGVTLLGTNLWGEAPLVQSGGVYVEQALFATPYLLESQSPRIRGFRERFEAMYNTPPSYLEAQAFDVVMMLLNARFAIEGGYVDRAMVLQNLLRTSGFIGVAGTYTFTAQGELTRDYELYQVQGGQLVQVGQQGNK